MAVIAYVLLRTKPGTSHQIIASRKIPGVQMASSVFGRYDAVLVISAKDMDELSKTMYDVIEKHPNVEHSECLISIPYPPEEKPKAPAETYSVISFACPSCNGLNRQGAAYCHLCGYAFETAEDFLEGKHER
ncbi:MAG: Lrp/AsnC family transcriptional regulator [Nitrososphaerales archaeon]